MAEILQEHHETEQWLHDYILDVAKDLEEELSPAADRGTRRERKRGKSQGSPNDVPGFADKAFSVSLKKLSGMLIRRLGRR